MAGVHAMKIVYIHGASATSDSFNYIRKVIGKSNDLVINYDSRNGFEKNLDEIKQVLTDEKKIFFIAHSLGGIYALHVAVCFPDQVIGAVTLSTPYGGAEIADVAKYFLPYSRLLKDIGPNSWAMKHSRSVHIPHKWTNIVTTKGDAPWVPGKNDGVVTIDSQKYRQDIMEIVEVEHNHYEVVLSDGVIKMIKERLPK